MFNENLYDKLEMFSITHIITLIIFIMIIVLMALFNTKISSKTFEKTFRITVGIFLLTFEVSYHIWILSRGNYTIDMLPLTGFCALTNWLTIYALLFNKTKMFNYLIYYATTGALFSLVFIDTTWQVPHFRFFHYFLEHFGFLIAALYYYFTKRLEINKRNLKRSIIYLFNYNLIILLVNIIFTKNYFYLIKNPIEEISNFFGLPLYTILWMGFIFILTIFWYYLLTGFKGDKNE